MEKLKLSNFLVTGGAGFIGSHLVEHLISTKNYVRVLDNFSTGKRTNLPEDNKYLEVVEGDICDLDIVRSVMKDIDFVLHQAALPSVTRSIQDPKGTHDVNVTGTLNLLIVATELRIKRFVYASSASVYGDTHVSRKDEKMIPNPNSPYAVSKLAAEYYCCVYNKLYGLETVCLRYFNVFGPRQDCESPYAAVIPKFITAILNCSNLTIYGDGTQTRDFTYIDNVVHANMLACQSDKSAGKIINIGGGNSTSLNDLIVLLRELIGVAVNPTYSAPRPGDIKHSQANIDYAKSIIGYHPRIGIKQGLMKTIKWFRER